MTYVVNIPVDNQHAVHSQAFLLRRVERSPRRHRDVVEEAEAHRAATLGVVP